MRGLRQQVFRLPPEHRIERIFAVSIAPRILANTQRRVEAVPNVPWIPVVNGDGDTRNLRSAGRRSGGPERDGHKREEDQGGSWSQRNLHTAQMLRLVLEVARL